MIAPAARILVVDDESPVRLLCQRILESKGYHVDTAENGGEALQRLAKEEFNVILTDWRMPGSIDGTELATRASAQSPNAIVIMMTAYPQLQKIVSAMYGGVFQCLIKPFDSGELMRVIQEGLTTQSTMGSD